MFRTLVVTCALTVLAAVTTTGCMGRYVSCGPEGETPAGLTASDLLGAWHGDWHDHPAGDLTLRADNSFTATRDWPDPEPFGGLPQEERPALTTGSWDLATPGDQADADLDLTFPDPHVDPDGGKYTVPYYVSGTRAEPVLYTYTDDPDLCEFHTLKRLKRPKR
ncbi:hypothetical protein ACIREE_20145 [Streptomyces sp. NPDC102467]|uniref:hypothetical protein n=1 Tax=Streptomyces sp. NPDC102467 TaxID=3366179 RepID=UPI00381B1DDD